MKSREIAVYILIDIFEQKSYNNLMLKEAFSKNELSQKDRAFVTELVNGSIRNIIYIDYIINKFSNTKTSKMKAFILNTLRVSVYQIMFMDKVPQSAICNEAVNLVKKKKFGNLSGFVNGVLRNIARNKEDILKLELDLATEYSYPAWVVEKWIKQFGYDTTKEILKANNKPPKVCICVNTNKTTRQELKNILKLEGMNVEEGKISKNSLYISKTSNIANSKAFKDGLFHIMDESSMLAVESLGIDKGDAIIDICSAPGGKSFYASYILENTGRIYARDIYSHKIELMQKTKTRLGVSNIELMQKDALEFYKEDEQKADKIILDVPCSGFGIVRKKPDIKYNKTREDIKELVNIQRRILENTASYLKVGGIMVYSTCTLFEEENIKNITWFCENFGFELCSIDLDINIDTKDKGYMSILPNMFGTDGFFIAKLKRIR